MSIFKDFAAVIQFLLFGIGALAGLVYAWSTIKSQRGKVDSEVIDTYREEMTVLKNKVERLETDNKEFIRKIGMLEGENRTLKEVLALRDPKFEEAFLSLSGCIKDMRDDLRKHYNADDKSFTQLRKVDDQKMEILKKLLENQTKEIIPRINGNRK